MRYIPPPHKPTTYDTVLTITDTSISDSGTRVIYITPSAPCTDINTVAPPINVGTASGTRYISTASSNLELTTLPVQDRHIIPGFQHKLVGIGPLCDHRWKVLYKKHTVYILDEASKVLLQGWREPTGARIWRFLLQPGIHHHTNNRSPDSPPPPLPTLMANNYYDMPSVNSLVRFLHAAAGFSVKSTWLASIKTGNYATWPGLNCENSKTYCLTNVETIKVHMT